MKPSVSELFESYVSKGHSCWGWSGPTDQSGYARVGCGYAHRFSYETHVGPIPSGLEVDHLCNNRACVNPDHLEPVTRRENVRRTVLRGTHSNGQREKTQCKRGHAFDSENTYVRGDGRRQCKKCNASYKHAKVAA